MSELDFHQMPKWMPEALEVMALVETWAKAYEVGREAILRHIPIAYAWCQSNPKNAPKRNVTRFLHTWMRNAKKWNNLIEKQPDRRYKADEPAGHYLRGDGGHTP